MKTKKSKKLKTPAAAAPLLERDLDGYVHTPAGFLSKAEYLKIAAENPDVNFPDFDALPLLRS